MITVLIIVIIVLAAYIFLIAPGRVSNAVSSRFSGRNYAHRGLHTKDKSVPENCLTGFKNAVDNGYGMEFDVHITADGQLVVFHDNSLERMCGVKGTIEELSLQELRMLRLANTDEVIPTFDEVLDTVGGKVPLIIELKAGKTGQDRLLCEKTAARLDKYDGPFCIESFDPRIVAWFRKNRRSFFRGQLAMPADGYKDSAGKLAAFGLSNVLANVIARPQFIAHKKGKKSFSVLLCEAMGAVRVVWTVHEEDEPQILQSENDAVIFEFYLPSVCF